MKHYESSWCNTTPIDLKLKALRRDAKQKAQCLRSSTELEKGRSADSAGSRIFAIDWYGWLCKLGTY